VLGRALIAALIPTGCERTRPMNKLAFEMDGAPAAPLLWLNAARAMAAFEAKEQGIQNDCCACWRIPLPVPAH